MNKRHGLGAMAYRCGDKYEGHWQQDRRHGQAQYVSQTGDVFEGNYKNDLREGPGTVQKVKAASLSFICHVLCDIWLSVAFCKSLD